MSFNSILFFDENCTLDKKELFQHSLIISFDYKSHKQLQENNIQHIISDNFLQENDYESIQQESHRLSYWYERPEISQYLLYDGMNLGELFYIEFHYELVPILKKIIEIVNNNVDEVQNLVEDEYHRIC